MIFYILRIKHNNKIALLEDLLLISGDDLFEGEVFSVWSKQICHGGNGI